MLRTDFIGRAKRLEDLDIPRIGSIIGVGEDEIHAFMDVEAAGSGFDSQGRPKMLFEPHVFYRNLSGEERQEAINRDLAYSRWGTQPYPRDSYPRLIEAMAINETAALKSASWGLGQILGENFSMVGYDSPQEMVIAFMEDEELHLEAIVRFLIAAGIADDLRAHRWTTVARAYNGPGYAKHGYHTRMARAYNKWAGIPDTPWDGEADDSFDAQPDSYPTVRLGSNGFVVEHLQRELAALGYHSGAIDGDFGRGTRASVLAFQADHNLTSDGVAGPQTWDVLENTARAKEVAPERAEATSSDLRAKGSSTIKNGDMGQAAGGVAVATGGISVVGDLVGQAEETSGLLGRAQSVLGGFSGLINDNWPLVLIVVGGIAVYYVTQMKRSRVQDHRSGANMGR